MATSERALAKVTPKELVKQRMEAMVRALPNDERTIERFKMAAFALASTKGISECTPESVCKCIYECARLGLIPDPIMQHAFIVPFRNHGTKEATLITGYKGLVELARRAEPQLFIDVGSVFSNDDYVLTQGSEQKLTIRRAWWESGKDDPGEIVFSWCVSAMPGQEKRLVIIPKQAGMKLAKASKSGYEKGRPWFDNFQQMCEKTAIRRSARLWSLNPTRQDARNLLRAIEIDEIDADDLPSLAESATEIMDGAETPTPAEGETNMGNLAEEKPATKQTPGQSVSGPLKPQPAAEVTTGRVNSPAINKATQEAGDAAAKAASELAEQQNLLTNALRSKFEAAGVEWSVATALAVLGKVAKTPDFDMEVLRRQNSTGLKIWRGEINAMSVDEFKAMLPAEEKPAEQEQKSEDAEPEINFPTCVDLWAKKRGITRELAKAGLEKVLNMKMEKDWLELTPDEQKALYSDILSEKIKFALFDGVK